MRNYFCFALFRKKSFACDFSARDLFPSPFFPRASHHKNLQEHTVFHDLGQRMSKRVQWLCTLFKENDYKLIYLKPIIKSSLKIRFYFFLLLLGQFGATKNNDNKNTLDHSWTYREQEIPQQKISNLVMQQKVCSLQILVSAKYETLFPRFGFPAKSSAIFPEKNEALLSFSRPGKRGECCVSDRPIELQSLQKKYFNAIYVSCCNFLFFCTWIFLTRKKLRLFL